MVYHGTHKKFVPEVVPFATRETRMLRLFVSHVPDPLAAGADVFSLDRSRWGSAYLLKPTNLLLRVLGALQHLLGRILWIPLIGPTSSAFR